MKLLIISNTRFYKDKAGKIVGWSPTMLENKYLSKHFESTRVIGMLYKEKPKGTTSPCSGKNLSLVPIEPSGGENLIEKFNVAIKFFSYLKTIRQEVKKLSKYDLIYVRCPCNIGLLACAYFVFARGKKLVFKYAGNWGQKNNESISYKTQRTILNLNLCNALVTVNGQWKKQPGQVLSFLNPCVTEKELAKAKKITKNKSITEPIRILFAGRVEKEKGINQIIEIAKTLKEKGIDFVVEIAGDGIESIEFKEKTKKLGLEKNILFCGWVSRKELFKKYKNSHFFVLPSKSEGWPKVLSEAMAFKCIPIASNVSKIKETMQKLECGFCIDSTKTEEWAEKIIELSKNKKAWEEMAKRCQSVAKNFSYEKILEKEFKNRIIEKLMQKEKQAKGICVIGNFTSKFGSTPQQCEYLSEKFSKEGFTVFKAGNKKNKALRAIEMATTLTKNRKKIDLIIMDLFEDNYFFVALAISKIAKLLNKPYFLILHDARLPSFAEKNKQAMTKLLKGAKKVIAPSSFLQKWCESLGAKAIVIPNPIDLKNYSFTKRKKISPKLFWLRHYHKTYNPKIAIETLIELKKSYPKSTLIMAGPDSGEKKKLEKVAKENYLEKNIEFLGKITKKQINQIGKKASIFINTTNFDNAPVSLVEAAAMGLPIVSTNVGGIPYLFENEKEALLVPPNNPKAMAKAIELLLKNPWLVQKLTKNARKKAESSDWKNIKAQWERIIVETK